MKTLVALAALMFLVTPVFASVSGQVYAGGQKAATLCASLTMYEDVSANGFIDLNRDGSWFSKARLVKGTGNIALAMELRSSSSGYRSLAVGPQFIAKDSRGSFQVNPWFDRQQFVLSVQQFHTLGERIWTYSWTDISRHEAKGTIRVGHKESAHLDTFVELRFNTLTHDNAVYTGISLH